MQAQNSNLQAQCRAGSLPDLVILVLTLAVLAQVAMILDCRFEADLVESFHCYFWEKARVNLNVFRFGMALGSRCVTTLTRKVYDLITIQTG